MITEQGLGNKITDDNIQNDTTLEVPTSSEVVGINYVNESQSNEKLDRLRRDVPFYLKFSENGEKLRDSAEIKAKENIFLNSNSRSGSQFQLFFQTPIWKVKYL